MNQDLFQSNNEQGLLRANGPFRIITSGPSAIGVRNTTTFIPTSTMPTDGNRIYPAEIIQAEVLGSGNQPIVGDAPET